MKMYVKGTDIEIVGSVENIQGIAGIDSFNEDGTPNYSGSTDIDWDSQVTVQQDDQDVFIGSDHEEYTRDKCELRFE